MVFLTLVNLARKAAPTQFWRKRQVFQHTSHMFGRRRNCYSLAIKALRRSLKFGAQGRAQKKKDMKELWETRLCGACEELDVDYDSFLEGLARCQIHLDRKSLADLCIWEPRTFEAVAKIAAVKAKEDQLDALDRPYPEGIYTKGKM